MPKGQRIFPITITNPSIEEYCFKHSSDLPIELFEIEQFTQQNILAHRMMSNHIQAHFLMAVSKMIQPKLVLEIGTFTGYSAICLAQGLQPDGKIITIEKKPEFVEMAQKFFDKFNYRQIQIVQGNALEIIQQFSDQKFDLIYLDADKEKYSEYFEMLITILSDKGWLLIDNTLWKGLVSEPPKEPVTEKIQQFNQYLAQQKNLFVSVLPIRDGITLVQKRK